MSKSQFAPKSSFRVFAAVLGIGLFAHLIHRTGPKMIWNHAQAVGWGLALIIALAGISHVIKTWAWRLTFTCDISGISWPRSLAMRLISEAIAQLGIAGKVLGEGVRVSLLGSAVPVANGVSSAALDAGLYTLTSAIVTVVGIVCALLFAPVSGKWRFYAVLFGIGTLAVVGLVAFAVAKRWQFAGKTARALGRLPRFQNWVNSKQSVIDSAEETLFTFHREAPRAFWASLALNFVCHVLAILEVFIILRFLGTRATLLGALALEGLTKLINSVGALNPGNVGTYEGGNIIITKIFGITAASGLTLALCRRARAIFWAAIGAACLILMKKVSQQDKTDLKSDFQEGGGSAKEEPVIPGQQEQSPTAIILADSEPQGLGLPSSLARIGTLPIMLRAILSVQGAGASRTIVCVPPGEAPRITSTLRRTGRLPESIEWREIGPEASLGSLIAEVAAASETIMLVAGNRTYQPRLLHSAMEWKGPGALALATDGELSGVYVLPQSHALALAKQASDKIRTLAELNSWILSRDSVEVQEVPASAWHKVSVPEDVPEAERKLDGWLVKPTDGLFARNNRRISIPISRLLIKLPLTPNMVTLLVLGVSIAAGAMFARGGYWNTLLGAALSVAASILDGCDGEVARLKLQSTKFGCWLETVCDYLYYLFVFGGMAVGLTRSSGTRNFLVWGALLCFGAVMSFLAVSFSRQRLSGSEPEKFLAVWQKKADSRASNPLLYLGRNCEFIIRRCFFPYALLFFAAVNLTKLAFVATALGANVVWLIALYSVVTFSRTKTSAVRIEDSGALSEQATA